MSGNCEQKPNAPEAQYLVELAGKGNGIRNDLVRVAMLD